MQHIIDVKEGIVGTVLAILFIAGIEGFFVYWWLFHDRQVLPFTLFGGLISLISIYGVIQSAGKTAFLAISGPDLVWEIKKRNEPAPVTNRISLHSLRTIEFVPPKKSESPNADLHVLHWKVFLIDVHGTRHQIPEDLRPDAYRYKIVSALREANPGIKVISNGLMP